MHFDMAIYVLFFVLAMLLALAYFPHTSLPFPAVGVGLLEYGRLERYKWVPSKVCYRLGQRGLRPHFHAPGEGH